jgi:hypothetical protein
MLMVSSHSKTGFYLRGLRPVPRLQSMKQVEEALPVEAD